MVTPGLRIYGADVQPNGDVLDSAIERECRLCRVENRFPSPLVTALRNFVRHDLINGPVYIELRVSGQTGVAFHFIQDNTHTD